MATKNSLTRDEAREAIKILVIRKDNLNNIMTATLGFFILLFSVIFTSHLTSDYPVQTSAVLVLIFIFSFYTFLRSKEFDEKANELAKRYNLEEFLNAVSGKNKCVNE